MNRNIEEAKRLYFNEHQSTIKIAEIFGCSTSTIWRLFNKNGIKLNKSEILKGRTKTEEHRRKLSASRIGIVISEEQREKIRAGMLRAVKRGHSGCFKKGQKPNITPERNAKISMATAGIKKSYCTGDKHYLWKGGVAVPMAQRTCEKSWNYVKKQVLQRDNGKCQKCGKDDGKIDIHHIVPWRLTHDDSIENLTTLCASCHRKEDARIAVNE